MPKKYFTKLQSALKRKLDDFSNSPCVLVFQSSNNNEDENLLKKNSCCKKHELEGPPPKSIKIILKSLQL